MKYLAEVRLPKIYESLGKEIEKSEKEILVNGNVLNIAQRANTLFYFTHVHEDLAIAKERLHYDLDMNDIDSIIAQALVPYENRKIEVEKKPDFNKIIDILKSYPLMDFVAGYRREFFEPLEMKKWEFHKPAYMDRMIFYALDIKNFESHKKGEYKLGREVNALEEIADEIGSLVAKKRKKYLQYAHRTYYLNRKEGLHARPSVLLVDLTNKYKEGDIWLRTERTEVNGKGIVGVMGLGLEDDHEITVLYKPAEKSADFYNDLESITIDSSKLFAVKPKNLSANEG